MRRLSVTSVLSIVLLLLSAGGASADWWNPTKRQPAGVSVTVAQPGGPGASNQAGTGGGRTCSYQKTNYPGDPGSELVNPPSPPTPRQQGSWYFYECSDAGAPGGTATGITWVADGQPVVAPAVLAQTARRYLPLPAPGIRTSPAAADQVVNVPTWLWVDPATWGTRSATASVPNETATVTATPVRVTWTMGDGRRVVCAGPGTPYSAGDPARPSPDCGHVYRRSSAGQGGLAYPVAATTSWRISWVASGVVAASGTLAPLERTATTSLRVAEAQTVN